MMKYSVFTVATPDLTPDQLCAAAEAAGIGGIEWRCKETSAEVLKEPPSFWGNNLSTISPSATPETVEFIKQSANNHGLKSIAIVPYLTCGDIEETERLFRLARSLGVSMMRVGVPWYDQSVGYNELLNSGYAYLDEVEALARDYGVKALIELHHGTIAPSTSAGYRLVSRYSPDRIGVLFDPGNMVHEGMENLRMGMQLLGPYLAHVHVKNAGWFPVTTLADGSAHPNAASAVSGAEGVREPAPLSPVEWRGEWRPLACGIVQWKQVLADLKSVGYEGWLGIEDFSKTYHSAEMLQTFVRQMREWEEQI